jgi:hypothetical protein
VKSPKESPKKQSKGQKSPVKVQAQKGKTVETSKPKRVEKPPVKETVVATPATTEMPVAVDPVEVKVIPVEETRSIEDHVTVDMQPLSVETSVTDVMQPLSVEVTVTADNEPLGVGVDVTADKEPQSIESPPDY